MQRRIATLPWCPLWMRESSGAALAWVHTKCCGGSTVRILPKSAGTGGPNVTISLEAAPMKLSLLLALEKCDRTFQPKAFLAAHSVCHTSCIELCFDAASIIWQLNQALMHLQRKRLSPYPACHKKVHRCVCFVRAATDVSYRTPTTLPSSILKLPCFLSEPPSLLWSPGTSNRVCCAGLHLLQCPHADVGACPVIFLSCLCFNSTASFYRCMPAS